MTRKRLLGRVFGTFDVLQIFVSAGCGIVCLTRAGTELSTTDDRLSLKEEVYLITGLLIIVI